MMQVVLSPEASQTMNFNPIFDFMNNEFTTFVGNFFT